MARRISEAQFSARLANNPILEPEDNELAEGLTKNRKRQAAGVIGQNLRQALSAEDIAALKGQGFSDDDIANLGPEAKPAIDAKGNVSVYSLFAELLPKLGLDLGSDVDDKNFLQKLYEAMLAKIGGQQAPSGDPYKLPNNNPTTNANTPIVQEQQPMYMSLTGDTSPARAAAVAAEFMTRHGYAPALEQHATRVSPPATAAAVKAASFSNDTPNDLTPERAEAIANEFFERNSPEAKKAREGRRPKIRKALLAAFKDKTRPIGSTDVELVEAVRKQAPELFNPDRDSQTEFANEVRTIARELGLLDDANARRTLNQQEQQAALSMTPVGQEVTRARADYIAASLESRRSGGMFLR
jgi:hypothetical protein